MAVDTFRTFAFKGGRLTVERKPVPLVELKTDLPPNIWNAELERAKLTNLFFGRYGGMLRSVHGLLTRATNQNIPPPNNADVRHMLLEARARAVKVDAVTQFAISAVIADGTRRGLSPHEIAYGTPTGDFPGIEGLFEKTWKHRALTVARTELQHAMLRANVDRFSATGKVQSVMAHDGDYDENCAARNGQVYPLANPPEMLPELYPDDHTDLR